MKILSISILVLFSLAAKAQSGDRVKIQKLDSLFNELDSNKMSMGSISIYKDGKPFYSRTYGISNIKNNAEIKADQEKTLYRIGSVSKVLTAYLIMKSVEEGKLSLNQSVESYFPTLAYANRITIKELLSHRSILPIFHRVDDLDQLRKAKTEEEMIATVNKAKMNTDTLKTTYNNLNYILLGLIIEKVNAKSYNEVLSSALSALPSPKTYGTTSALDYLKNEANSFHVENEEWKEDYENRESPIADGSGFLVSDARTLNEFMYRLFTYQLLKKETVEEMLPDTAVFGFGLMKANFDEHKGFGHTGRIEGFTAATNYFPKERLGITLLQNGTVYPMNDILIFIGDILFDEPLNIPGFKKMELSAEDINKLKGVYVNDKEGYKLLVDINKNKLRVRLEKGKGLLNKMILSTYALDKNRLFNPRQGIILDFSHLENGAYNTCIVKVNGAKLPMERTTIK